ncbi:LysR family transcriptional regulator [Motiliproteus coralliicola]|uniref:LysR family transcriptional regulator n=1 Tax=Motiliproteus coralliicola TaxID=2283196 RepID=A0A369WT52_9GAMM|nr:LysR family transcriptional regulator [Motiliproteus coralliicola]RDE22675.1 LysR family transcriptional regulator [Motiliproteus coralliicola]
MDLQQIKYFLAVVDNGTFLAASKQVHVTQPTLSAGIRKLEQSLGVTLFNRGSRSATLTAEGEQFLKPARQSYNQLVLVRSKLRKQPEKIVIGVLSNIHMDHVARIISSYRSIHPHILIELVVDADAALSRMLAEKKVDLIIVNSDTQADNFQPIIRESLCIVVPGGHPWANERLIELKSLDGERFIERIRCGFWEPVNQQFQQQQIQPLTVMQAESDEFVLSLVAANLGVSIITDRTTPYDVRFIEIKDLSIDRSIGVCMPNTDVLPHVEAFYRAVLDKRD